MDGLGIPNYGWLLLVLGLCIGGFPLLDRTRSRDRFLASAVSISIAVTYTVWRAFLTLNLDDAFDGTMSIAFFLLEATSNLSAIAVMILLVRTRSRTEEVDAHLAWIHRTRPSVAIFIATYNEDRGILNRSIIGAQNQDYPVDIYLLDDGRRPEIEALCRQKGVGYLTRPDNRHAKAGNMNAGLASLVARDKVPDFIAILDADFVPFPRFVSRSLALFHDEQVGVVQTPQHFFNPDPLQHSFRAPFELPDEQRFFFDTLLPAKDGWDTAFSCGTSSLVRTSALQAVGGFPTDSITEDMLLSIRMKRFGFRTAYLNEQLSLGLAPEGLSEYCTQRIRWCVGAMQIVRGKDGLRAGNGLKWMDRAGLVDTLLYWVGSFPFRIFCLLVPILYWFSGRTVMTASLDDLTLFLGSKLIVEAFSIAWYSKGRLLPVLTDVSQLLIAPEIVAASLFTLLKPGEKPFKVTNKGGDRSNTVVHWWMIWRFLLVAAATVGGLLFNYLSPLAPAYFSDQKQVVTFWSMYNLLICMVGINVSVEQPRRSDERIPLREEASLSLDGQVIPVHIRNISSGGIAFSCASRLAIGQTGILSTHLLGDTEVMITRAAGGHAAATFDLDDAQFVRFTRFRFAGTNHLPSLVAPMRSLKAMVNSVLR